VYAAALKWTKFDLPAREKLLPKLLEHVRLPLCPPKFLVNTVSKDSLVMADAACRELVDEAKNCLLLQLPAPGRPSMQGPRTRPRKPFKFPEVLYLVGGFRGSQPLSSVEWIDPGEASPVWKPAASMSKPIFDPVTNQWSNIASMHTIRESCGVAAMGGFLYAVGGVRGTECLNVVERYDPGRNAWTNVAPTRSRRCGVSVAVVNGCLYAVGGRDGWLTWSTVESTKWQKLKRFRSQMTLAVVNEKLYAVGDAYIEVYDKELNFWKNHINTKD
ncbi:kelch repeat protein, partial [Ostertagia ostertagi]